MHFHNHDYIYIHLKDGSDHIILCVNGEGCTEDFMGDRGHDVSLRYLINIPSKWRKFFSAKDPIKWKKVSTHDFSWISTTPGFKAGLVRSVLKWNLWWSKTRDYHCCALFLMKVVEHAFVRFSTSFCWGPLSQEPIGGNTSTKVPNLCSLNFARLDTRLKSTFSIYYLQERASAYHDLI